MTNSPKIGVYICHCGKNISDVIDVEKLTAFAHSLPNVSVSHHYKFMCSNAGQELIKNDIQNETVNRVVVAACSPLMHEQTFRKVLRDMNTNEFFFEQANIREQGSWVSLYEPRGALDIAQDHLHAAVAKVARNLPLYRQRFPVTKSVMIIGGGIAGMFAALDLADKYPVYLIEKSPTIGGHMAQLDKTFPTMDCSACIITPKMVEVHRHPNIHLITSAQIEDMELTVGNFRAHVHKSPRRISPEKCTGCGTCADVCPITTPNEFDLNMRHRGAAYIPFPQAIPPYFTIDTKTCIECGICQSRCEMGAINLTAPEEWEDITVGSIIVATGYQPYDPSRLAKYGYRFKNVLTALEFERLLSSAGPTFGKVLRPSDKKEPKRIAFLQCVGSRNFRENEHHYCSRVCCMYAIKQARQLKEKYRDAEVYILYIDIRAFGKGYEEFYEIAGREYGVNFLRGRIGEISEDLQQNLILRGVDTLVGDKYKLTVDLLVLSIGMEAQTDTATLGHQLGVQCTEDGMFMEAHPKLRPVDSLSDGIFFAGTCQSPKDIPDTVAQAKAAASSADNFLAKGEIETEPYYAVVMPGICSGCRSCVNLCTYSAISFNEEFHVAEINSIKCKGCGTCVSSCPSEAIIQNHFTREQILSEINAICKWPLKMQEGNL